jgi:(p)ppGpp synthase/HD superfamily hydrolase
MKLTEILEESEASEEAKKKGLVSKGWGNWADKSGNIVAKTVKGKLEFTKKQEPTKSNELSPTDVLAYAEQVHGDQKYGDKPYSYHLKKVYHNAVKYGGSYVAKTASLLHDVLEDTPITKPELAAKVGPQVADVVDLVSNQPSKEDTLRRIRSNPDAVFVKLCDRLANVQEGQKNDKYRKEQPLFKSILYRQGEHDNLWAAIDKALGVQS